MQDELEAQTVIVTTIGTGGAEEVFPTKGSAMPTASSPPQSNDINKQWQARGKDLVLEPEVRHTLTRYKA